MSFLVKRGKEKSTFEASWYNRRYMDPVLRKYAEREMPTLHDERVQHGFVHKDKNGNIVNNITNK